jgi:BON domain-containing protein
MGRTKAEVRGRAARRAAKASKASGRTAAELKAGELLERVREAEPVARVQAAGADIAERVREAHLDERAAQLAERVRESEAAQRAAAAAKRAGDQALERAGEWIATSGAAERLGVEPKRRRWPGRLLFLLLGVGLGYLAAWLLRRRAESEGDALADSADWLAATPPSDTTTGGGEMPTVAGPVASDRPLEEDVRVSLHADPRTADLPDLAIDVADGTVFIRGSVPADFDGDQIRAVVIEVPGVTDVDLQLTPA